MDLIDFSSWSPGALGAFAVIATMSLIVLGVIFFFRELGARPSGEAAVASGRFGFDLSRGEQVRMKVLQIRELSDSVKNFRLKPLDHYADYRPGQFLTFHLGEDQSVPRCYSLNSSPSRPGLYEVAVKRLDGGVGSTWMHDRVSVGDTLSVTNPAGRFCLQEEGDATVLVAGGIGVTPMISMLAYLVDCGASRPVYFFYCTRSSHDLVFGDEIADLASRCPSVHYIPVLSRADQSWTGKKGRLSEEIMLEAGIDFSNAELYTCGPVPLMELAKEIAVKNGMPESRFHNEVFASPASAELAPRQAKIKVDGRTIEYDGSESLLDFLNAHGVPIPFSCKAGVCGTCEIGIGTGEVESLPSEYLSEEDRAAGRCLSCISFPKGDLSVDN